MLVFPEISATDIVTSCSEYDKSSKGIYVTEVIVTVAFSVISVPSRVNITLLMSIPPGSEYEISIVGVLSVIVDPSIGKIIVIYWPLKYFNFIL